MIRRIKIFRNYFYWINRCKSFCRNVYLRNKYNIHDMEGYFRIKNTIDLEEVRNMDLWDSDMLGDHCRNMELLRLAGGLIRKKEWLVEKERERNELEEMIILSDNQLPEDFDNEVNYLKECGELRVFPYPFVEEYNSRKKDVIIGRQENLKYVIHNNRKLFFPNRDNESVITDYIQLVMEQDKASPHEYFSEKVSFEGGIFVDVGSAEGIISLDVVDKASDIYLIEGTKEWIKALQKTFEDYSEKTHIIQKYAGCVDSNDVAKLDSILGKYRDKDIFIKMDVEGMEIEVLRGCVETIKNNRCKFSCACYHTNTMETRLKEFFDYYGYRIEVSDGYMLFNQGIMTLRNGMYEKMRYPYFRRGLVRAYKD